MRKKLAIFSVSIFDVCVPRSALSDNGTTRQRSDVILETERRERCRGAGTLYDHLARDLEKTLGEILLLLLLAFFSSFSFVAILRFEVTVVLWIFLLLSVFISLLLPAYLWYQYSQYSAMLAMDEDPESHDSSYVDAW